MRATGGSVSKKRGEKCGERTYFRVTHAMYTGEKAFEWKGNKKKKKGGISPGATRGFLFAIFALNPSLRRIDIFGCRIRLENNRILNI